jgi:uncharacterized protein (DUF1015 family)
MVAIAPFRALRYDPGRIDLARATSPPHDCITAAQRDAFLAAEPRNVVRVVLGPEIPGDGEGPGPPSRHDRARAALEAWQREGAMARDRRPALYHYQVTWGPPEARLTMSGLVARVALDPAMKEVRPHEKTLGRKRKDRLRLREATGADCEPIWLLYRDRRGWVEEVLSSNAYEELARFTDEEGTEHRLSRVDRPEAVEEVVAQFDGRTVVIADGHHRYQTALEHHAATGRPEHGSILACLVRDNDPGIRILATHRVLHGTGMDAATALARAAAHWEARAVEADGPASLARLADAPGTAILLAPGPHGVQAHLLQLRPGSDVAQGRGRLDALAVTLVHDRLLRDSWGLDPEHPERNLRFERDPAEAWRQVAAGEAELAVLLPPEPVDAVLDVASEGQLMPQKATYFVPKLRSGLVLSPLDEPMPVPWSAQAGGPGKASFRLPPLG